MFVPGRPFQPGLKFVGKSRGLPKSEAPELTCTFQVLHSGKYRPYSNLLVPFRPEKNTLAYFDRQSMKEEKKFYRIVILKTVIITFCVTRLNRTLLLNHHPKSSPRMAGLCHICGCIQTRRYDSQHNDTQHNDTKHDTQHK